MELVKMNTNIQNIVNNKLENKRKESSTTIKVGGREIETKDKTISEVFLEAIKDKNINKNNIAYVYEAIDQIKNILSE